MGKAELNDRYLINSAGYKLLETKAEKLLILLSVLRLVIFLGGLGLTCYVFTVSLPAGILVLTLFSALFFRLLKLYLAHSDRKAFLGTLSLINQNEAAALSGDLSAFDPGTSFTDPRHDFSFDVDLFGPSSLFRYLNRTVTVYGKEILAGWLSDPFMLADDLPLRQDAVREMASKDKFRQEFMATGMKVPFGKSEISDLLGWIEGSSEIRSSRIKLLLIYILPGAAAVSLALLAAALIPYSIFVLVFLINLLFIATGLKRTNEIHNALTRKYNFLSSINGLLEIFEKEPFEAARLKEIRMNISGDTTSASVAVRRLGKLIHAFDSRMNMVVGFALNGLLLWDYHCIYKLEKWKSEYKTLFPLWLEMIGQADAYISLGNYAFNNPAFTYPSVSVNSDVFSARELGHPLIDESKRICNDFVFGKKGTVCIISGANMAGKSTFLRTVAVNFILAMTGAPVCASELHFKPVKLFTSMRTTDSLAENESYFYAELKRLKLLKSRIENDEPVFFILDEILKGTNSTDKSTGSKLFLKRITESKGTGLLATHDISLGELEPEYPGTVVNKCFEIEIDGESILFDYKIRDGITKKMNAVFLMKQMGILD